MESLTGLNETSGKKIKAPDGVGRIKIGKVESDKLATLVQQAQGASKGFLALSKSDIVNFLIREQKSELSPKQMQQLRAQFYDPIRHMNWITQALKEALMSGDMATVSNLQGEIKGIELSVINRSQEDVGELVSRTPARSVEKQRRPRRRKAVADSPSPDGHGGDSLSDIPERT